MVVALVAVELERLERIVRGVVAAESREEALVATIHGMRGADTVQVLVEVEMRGHKLRSSPS